MNGIEEVDEGRGRGRERGRGEDWAILCRLAVMRALRVIALPAGFVICAVLGSAGGSLESCAHAATGSHWSILPGTNYNV